MQTDPVRCTKQSGMTSNLTSLAVINTMHSPSPLLDPRPPPPYTSRNCLGVPRPCVQGRAIVLCEIVCLTPETFLVLERDSRGLGGCGERAWSMYHARLGVCGCSPSLASARALAQRSLDGGRALSVRQVHTGTDSIAHRA